MTSLWGQVLGTGLARTLGLVISAVSLFVAARFLGPSRHGELAAALNWMNLLATVGCLSLGQVALHVISGQPRERWLGPVLGTLLAMTAGLSLLLAAGLAAMHAVGSVEWLGAFSPGTLMLASCLLPPLIWDTYATQLVTAADRLQTYNVAQALGRVLTLVVLAAGLAAGGGIGAALTAIIAGNAFIAAANVLDLARHAGPRVRPSAPLARRLLVGGLRLHWNAVATFLILPAGVLVVNALRSSAETGYYQLALQLFGALTVVPTSAAVVLYGRVARDGADRAWGVQRRVLGGMAALMVAAAGAAALAAPWLVTVLAGEAFAPSVGVFRVLLLAMLGITISTVMAPQWIGRGLFLQASAITVVLGVTNLAVTVWLVPELGVNGAAWAVVVTYSLFTVANLAMAWHCERRWAHHAPAPSPDN